MNAAARLLNQKVLSRGWVVSLFLTRFQFNLFVVVFSSLLSALSIVYVTNLTRSLNAEIQQTFSEQDQFHLQWEQLLLEKSTLLTQARIQNVAEQSLGMVLPDNKSVVTISE